MRLSTGIAMAALALAGCGSSDEKPAVRTGPKTALSDAQFSEVKANCNLGNAVLRTAGAPETRSGADGSTSTVTISFDGPPDQKTIVLPAGVSQKDFSAAFECLKAEFARLGAEAKLHLPKGLGV